VPEKLLCDITAQPGAPGPLRNLTPLFLRAALPPPQNAMQGRLTLGALNLFRGLYR
jgi:hypothetical protein